MDREDLRSLNNCLDKIEGILDSINDKLEEIIWKIESK